MESICCPLCGESQATSLWTKNDASYVQCTRCDLVYENPRLTDDELREFYSDANYYINTTGDSTPSGYADYFAQCSPALVREYLEIVKQSVRAKEEIHFLDVGCGPGTLVKAAQDLGWNAVGIELSHWSVELGRKNNLEIMEGTLERAAFPSNSFDAISLFDVLEHLPHPVEYIKEIHRILRPSGVVIVETPNIGGFFAWNLYKQRSYLVKPRAHICLYSPATTQRLFRAAPFSDVSIKTFPYCRRFTPGYFKSLVVSRLRPSLPVAQLTYNESLRIRAWK